MRRGRTFRSGRTHPADGQSNNSETLSRIQSLADYTIDTLESSFQKRQHQRFEAPRVFFRYFAMIAGLNVPTKETGDRGMGGVDVLREKAEEYLEKARVISDRQRA